MSDLEHPETDSRKLPLSHRIGQWLLDDEKKDADLAKLMKYNIVISFLTFGVVAGDADLAARLLTFIPL